MKLNTVNQPHYIIFKHILGGPLTCLQEEQQNQPKRLVLYQMLNLAIFPPNNLFYVLAQNLVDLNPDSFKMLNAVVLEALEEQISHLANTLCYVVLLLKLGGLSLCL